MLVNESEIFSFTNNTKNYRSVVTPFSKMTDNNVGFKLPPLPLQD